MEILASTKSSISQLFFFFFKYTLFGKILVGLGRGLIIYFPDFSGRRNGKIVLILIPALFDVYVLVCCWMYGRWMLGDHQRVSIIAGTNITTTNTTLPPPPPPPLQYYEHYHHHHTKLWSTERYDFLARINMSVDLLRVLATLLFMLTKATSYGQVAFYVTIIPLYCGTILLILLLQHIPYLTILLILQIIFLWAISLPLLLGRRDLSLHTQQKWLPDSCHMACISHPIARWFESPRAWQKNTLLIHRNNVAQCHQPSTPPRAIRKLVLQCTTADWHCPFPPSFGMRSTMLKYQPL